MRRDRPLRPPSRLLAGLLVPAMLAGAAAESARGVASTASGIQNRASIAGSVNRLAALMYPEIIASPILGDYEPFQL